MKKSNLLKISNLLIAVLFVALLGTLTACGDDHDDNNNAPNNATASIIGTWKMTYSWGYEAVTFNSNGTGTWIDVDNDYSDTYVGTFTWSLKGNILTIIKEDSYSSGSYDVYKYEIVSLDANKLVVREIDDYYGSYYGDYSVWTRQ